MRTQQYELRFKPYFMKTKHMENKNQLLNNNQTPNIYDYQVIITI